MDGILNWLTGHIGAAIGGTAVISLMVGLFGKRIVKAACKWTAQVIGKEIAAVENIKTGNPKVDGLLNLAILALMMVANEKMPAAPGEDKKKYVMSHFSTLDPAIQNMLSAAIDQLWSTWKLAIDAGATPTQEAILMEAVEKLKSLLPPPAVV